MLPIDTTKRVNQKRVYALFLYCLPVPSLRTEGRRSNPEKQKYWIASQARNDDARCWIASQARNDGAHVAARNDGARCWIPLRRLAAKGGSQ